MQKIKRRYVLIAYSNSDTLSKDALRAMLRNAYLRIPNRRRNFNNIFLLLQKGYAIFSIPHSLVEDFKEAAREEFSNKGSKCDVILVSGTLRALREKAGKRIASRGL